MEKRKSMRELAEIYYKKNKNNIIQYDYRLDRRRKFDFIITQKYIDNFNNRNIEKKIGVFICDMQRTIGLNILRKIQYMFEDAEELDEVVLIGRDFSSQVRKFSKSYEVKLLSLKEIEHELNCNS